MRARLDLSDEAGHRFAAPQEIFANRGEWPESVDAASRKIREARFRRFPLSRLDDPLRDNAARGFGVDAGLCGAGQTGIAEAERQREIVLCG